MSSFLYFYYILIFSVKYGIILNRKEVYLYVFNGKATIETFNKIRI